MAAKKGGLGGKGISALIPEAEKVTNAKVSNSAASSDEAANGILEVDINKVEPNKNQPRKTFNEDSILELSESIKQHGILDPLLVQERDGYYEIIGGERRWRASKKAGLKKVPVIVGHYTEQEIVELSLIENIQREDLNAIEEGQTYARLIEEFNLTQDEVAKKVSKERSTVTNAMRLLKLDDRVQQMVIDNLIKASSARTLLGIDNKEEQYELAMRILDEGLSVRDIEKEIRRIKNGDNGTGSKKEKSIDPKLQAIYNDLEEKLKTAVGTKVSIVPKDNQKGKVEIEYYNQDDLDKIIDLLQSRN